MNKKLVAIVEGVLLITIGVLVAVLGQESFALLAGIVLLVIGAGLLALDCYGLIKEKKLIFAPTLGAVASILFGILFVLGKLDAAVAVIIAVAMWLGVAFGGALVLYSIYSLCFKKDIKSGVAQLIVGGAVATICLLYMYVDGFSKVFWIIAGVLVALSGLYIALIALLSKEAK